MMKIKEINFTNHYLFKNMHIDFTDDDGEALDLVVLAGVNGSGKSTLFREVYDFFIRSFTLTEKDIPNKIDIKAKQITLSRRETNPKIDTGLELIYSLSDAEIKTFQDTGALELIEATRISAIPYRFEHQIVVDHLDKLLKQKIIYSPLETNRVKFSSDANYYQYSYKYLNMIDREVLDDIGIFYMTLLDRFLYSDMKRVPEESMRLFAQIINETFECFDIQTEFVGRSSNNRLPLFKNKSGNVFDINGLSSGEKQLFCRFMAFNMVEPDNAIIMIDEPENSLHPAWQQGIVDMLMGLGINNQVIIATQSPHVISSAPKESLRFLELTTDPDEPVTVAKWKDFDMNNGMPAERIMREIMGLDSTRSKDMAKSIDDMWNRVKNDDPNNETLKKDFDNLVSILGNTDEDIILMRTQLNLRKNGKKYVINR